MRTIKLIGAMFVVLAFSAVATASAAETLWKWLPGSVGETFTGKSGKATLQVKGGISSTCAKSTIKLTGAELIKEGSTSEKDATLAIAAIDFEECTAAGLPMNSVGDAAKTILAKLAIHNCMIKAGDFGLLFKLTEEVKVEVPSTKLTIIFKGSFVGLIEGKAGTKALTFLLNIKQKEGKQEIEKCEGGVAQTLLAKIDVGVFAPAGEEAKEGTLTFDMTKDTEGEEMMEK